MKPEFFFMLNVVLASRLLFLFRDGPLTTGGVLLLSSIQIAGILFFQPGVGWAILLCLLLVTALTFHRLEKPHARNEWPRLLSLAVQIALLSVFFSPWIGISFNSGLMASVAGIGKFTLIASFLERFSSQGTSVVLMGALLVVNESNHFLRILLAGLRVGPQTAPGSGPEMTAVDRREYNTGRVIGILERIIIYMAVLTGQIGAIGLVLAVKGLARFKEMDHRQFAEYVLVGTLLSALLAVLVAIMVKSLMQ